MKKRNSKMVLSKILFVAFILSMLIVSCSPDTTPSLYSDKDGGATPVITSMVPTQGLAGVTEITISGENFSAEAADNFVYFGPLRANIISATTTELKVLAPDLVDDSIQVKIAVAKVEKFSNTEQYILDAAVEEVYPFLERQQPYAITVDDLGNIYFSLTEDGTGKGIKKITPDGDMIDFAPVGGETFFMSLKYKTGGTLYGVRGLQAIFEITEGNSAATFVIFGTSNKMFDLDFDKDGNIWTAGKGGEIFRVTPDKDVKSFAFADNVNALRVFNDYLYLSVTTDDAQNIMRMPIISADSLGAAELYFAFSSKISAGVEIESFTFSDAGQMYIATSTVAVSDDPMNPILFVNSDGTFGTWYPDLIGSFSSTITWGPGINAFMVRDKYVNSSDVTVFAQTILRLNMERLGAPEYGRD